MYNLRESLINLKQIHEFKAIFSPEILQTKYRNNLYKKVSSNQDLCELYSSTVLKGAVRFMICVKI